MKNYIGIEFGSTRIKAVSIDEKYEALSSGDYVWKSQYVNGIWTYDLDEVWEGLKKALSGIEDRSDVQTVGISAMMHGYLAFDADWNLLVPFRTWQNTMTGKAAEVLTSLFGFNIPQRWSIAHLYQAVLNNEPHLQRIAHITTLAGYVHYMLTGVNALGIGDASGMFPIDSQRHDYDEEMLSKFDYLIAEKKYPWTIRELLPKVLVAGEDAGCLTAEGENRIAHLLPAGTRFAPAEGDAGTGMTATNAVAPRTGNISAGTSIFSMVVLEKPLKKVYPEIDVVTTPSGEPVAMVHCNNCTNDMNAWINVLKETAELFGAHPSTNEIYTKLYNQSLEGSTDCGGLTVYNYMAGESVTHLNEGRPLVVRRPDSDFSLANFMRAQLYSSISTLKTGMDILFNENVQIDSLTGHGGLFKTPGVGQKYLAAACNTSITVLENAGEGGPYGMALLAAYCSHHDNISLTHFLESEVFLHTRKITLIPSMNDVKGFNEYHKRFTAGLAVEQEAVKNL